MKKSKTKEITPKQYAEYKKCTVANISKKLRTGVKLENVLEIKKFDRFYVLVVPETWMNEMESLALVSKIS